MIIAVQSRLSLRNKNGQLFCINLNCGHRLTLNLGHFYVATATFLRLYVQPGSFMIYGIRDGWFSSFTRVCSRAAS